MGPVFVPLDVILLIITTVLITCLCLTLLSNVICCYIFFKPKNRKSRPKILIGNIAFSDTIYILVTVFPLMIIMPAIIEKDIYFSHIIQSITNYLNATTLYANAFGFTIIACDRYYVITKLLKSPFDKISSKTLLCLIWV